MNKNREIIKEIGSIIGYLEKNNLTLAVERFEELIKKYPYRKKLENPTKDESEEITQIILDIDSHLKNAGSVSLNELKKYYQQILDKKIMRE